VAGIAFALIGIIGLLLNAGCDRLFAPARCSPLLLESGTCRLATAEHEWVDVGGAHCSLDRPHIDTVKSQRGRRAKFGFGG